MIMTGCHAGCCYYLFGENCLSQMVGSYLASAIWNLRDPCRLSGTERQMAAAKRELKRHSLAAPALKNTRLYSLHPVFSADLRVQFPRHRRPRVSAWRLECQAPPAPCIARIVDGCVVARRLVSHRDSARGGAAIPVMTFSFQLNFWQICRILDDGFINRQKPTTE